MHSALLAQGPAAAAACQPRTPPGAASFCLGCLAPWWQGQGDAVRVLAGSGAGAGKTLEL